MKTLERLVLATISAFTFSCGSGEDDCGKIYTLAGLEEYIDTQNTDIASRVPGNQPPVAVVSYCEYGSTGSCRFKTETNHEMCFDASQSYDPEGLPIYRFCYVKATKDQTHTTNIQDEIYCVLNSDGDEDHTELCTVFEECGIYEAGIMVIDNDGMIDREKIFIQVEEENE